MVDVVGVRVLVRPCDLVTGLCWVLDVVDVVGVVGVVGGVFGVLSIHAKPERPAR